MVTLSPPNSPPTPVVPGGEDTPRLPMDPDPADAPEMPRTVELRSVEFHAVTARQAVTHILGSLAAGKGGVVVTPNLDHLRRCETDLSFGALLSEADLVLADGMPLIWASRILGRNLPERVAGSDLITTLSVAAGHAGRSVFLLGGEPGTADGAAKVLIDRSGGALKIAGTYCPDFGFENDPAQMAQMIEALREAKPDIVFVGLGSPKQEKVVDIIRHNLPQTWWLGVGVSFSFLCGHVQRAPIWAQKMGLEWLHRVWQEPGRLLKRYFVHGIPFAGKLISGCFKERMGMENPAPGRYRRPPSYAAGAPSTAAKAAGTSELTGSGGRRHGAVGDAMAPRLDKAARGEAGEDVADDTPGSQKVLGRLALVVLLGGKLRHDRFTGSLDRSLLEMPLGDGHDLLDHWLAGIDKLAEHAGLDHLPAHVSLNLGEERQLSRSLGRASCESGADKGHYRGTAGVLRDLAENLDDDAQLLVANAGQMLLEPLPALARTLAAKKGDVTIVSHDDGTPSGLMLVRAGALRSVPDEGYHDMKEQHLPKIAEKEGMTVKVLRCRRPTALPIRTLGDYIAALRLRHAPMAARRGEVDPLDDGMGAHHAKRFDVVEPGADVAADAHLHDTVVLAGGRVESGANLARSLVTPGGVVSAGQDVLDEIVTGPLLQRDGEPLKAGAA
jgi:N-acetylglucosaminyldiphosphoundecaprenol N-acetyl-beta-D-mannosaminyltransferase